jgi:hypothetical protein
LKELVTVMLFFTVPEALVEGFSYCVAVLYVPEELVEGVSYCDDVL